MFGKLSISILLIFQVLPILLLCLYLTFLGNNKQKSQKSIRNIIYLLTAVWRIKIIHHHNTLITKRYKQITQISDAHRLRNNNIIRSMSVPLASLPEVYHPPLSHTEHMHSQPGWFFLRRIIIWKTTLCGIFIDGAGSYFNSLPYFAFRKSC